MEIPLFPLHLVLFPGRPLPLHLFEPRYRFMLADCLAGERSFGVIAIRSGAAEGGAIDVAEDLFGVGTIANIEHVAELADGRSDIITRGHRRFRVEHLLHDRPYLRAAVEPLTDEPPAPGDQDRGQELRDLLLPYLAELGAPLELLERIPHEPGELAWLAAAAMQVEVPQQQRLLECDSTALRLTEALRMLRRETGLMRHFGTVGSLRPAGPGGAELN